MTQVTGRVVPQTTQVPTGVPQVPTGVAARGGQVAEGVLRRRPPCSRLTGGDLPRGGRPAAVGHAGRAALAEVPP